MNKIRVIKKSDQGENGRSTETCGPGSKPTKRELTEVVGDWIADWRSRTQIETRRALDECSRFRMGS
ncbi:MAG: hypothetical protein ABJA02_08375 [Acidobacteriota bacterium]